MKSWKIVSPTNQWGHVPKSIEQHETKTSTLRQERRTSPRAYALRIHLFHFWFLDLWHKLWWKFFDCCYFITLKPFLNEKFNFTDFILFHNRLTIAISTKAQYVEKIQSFQNRVVKTWCHNFLYFYIRKLKFLWSQWDIIDNNYIKFHESTPNTFLFIGENVGPLCFETHCSCSSCYKCYFLFT